MLPNPFKQNQNQRSNFGGGENFGEGGRGNNRRGRGGRTSSRGGARGNARGGWKNRHNSRDELSNKEKNWGKVMFNPIAKNAREDIGTPWSKYKHELVQKQHEEEKSNKVNVDSEKAKEFLKKREENYRRQLITQKHKEPTKWEDFNDGNENEKEKPTSTTTTKKVKKNKKKQKPNKNEDGDTQASSSTKQLFVDKELLENFDSKKLSFAQNNTFRKVITKTLHTSRGSSLGYIVKDMKRKRELQQTKQQK